MPCRRARPDIHIEPGEDKITHSSARRWSCCKNKSSKAKRGCGCLGDAAEADVRPGYCREAACHRMDASRCACATAVWMCVFATMPTTHGESVVMRLLNQSSALLSLRSIWAWTSQTEAAFPPFVGAYRGAWCWSPDRRAAARPPRCTRRSTTSTGPGVKVITVEDPVEYRLDRITQVQVMSKIGLDFARVLAHGSCGRTRTSFLVGENSRPRNGGDRACVAP